MITLDCKYNQIKVFADVLEASAESQLRAMCEQPFMAGSKIRIMPDVHMGKGCTIGTTMTIGEYVVPSMVGVDIGCGMLTVKLEEKRLNLPKLDSFIRQNIPHGRDVRERAHRSHGRLSFDELRCYKKSTPAGARRASARWAAETISSRWTGTMRETSIW